MADIDYDSRHSGQAIDDSVDKAHVHNSTTSLITKALKVFGTFEMNDTGVVSGASAARIEPQFGSLYLLFSADGTFGAGTISAKLVTINELTDFATKTELEAKANKLDIGANSVPRRRTGTGEADSFVEYSTAPSASTLVMRQSSTAVRVGTPSLADDAATKKYVDDAITALRIELGG